MKAGAAVRWYGSGLYEHWSMVPSLFSKQKLIGRPATCLVMESNQGEFDSNFMKINPINAMVRPKHLVSHQKELTAKCTETSKPEMEVL